MAKKNSKAPAVTIGHNGGSNVPAPAEPFNLRKRVYEDLKQTASDFEKKHPGTTRKLACTTAIGLAGTAIVDTVIILNA